MRVIRHHDPAAFQKLVLPMLMRDEAMNHLTVGILTDLTTLPPRPLEKLILCAIEDDRGDIVATAVRTLASLVLTESSPQTVQTLVEFLMSQKIEVPSLAGPSRTAGTFAKLWMERNGFSGNIKHRMKIMKLLKATLPPGVRGTFREATINDVDKLTAWSQAFCTELNVGPRTERADMERRIKQKRLFVWCDPEIVSMAGISGPTPNGIRVNSVYTPHALRRRGYASACVAILSKLQLDAGRKFVFLYVDAMNPTTNRIYESIGYAAICDWEEWQMGDHQ